MFPLLKLQEAKQYWTLH
uniref:Uncharacterized protein n=1 Tax=Anguilla anguilla TaxID=7936 RepID=A0A0E9VF08_ANGAN